MKNFAKLRKAIAVFQQYGISLFGHKKFDNLYWDLKMDKVFVLGLIYELEIALGEELDDEVAYSAQIPAKIIDLLING